MYKPEAEQGTWTAAQWRWARWLPYVALCRAGGRTVWLRMLDPVAFDEGEG